MPFYGYGGKVLRVDLTERKFCIEELDRSWVKDVIGGRGANTRRLLEELDVDCDPLGPENLLIFGVGPLTGTLLPASAYYTVSAKSPFTGFLGDSAAGGQFAAEMKLTGFDQIIIKGKADRPVYLLVTGREPGAFCFYCFQWEPGKWPLRHGGGDGSEEPESGGCTRETFGSYCPSFGVPGRNQDH